MTRKQQTPNKQRNKRKTAKYGIDRFIRFIGSTGLKDYRKVIRLRKTCNVSFKYLDIHIKSINGTTI